MASTKTRTKTIRLANDSADYYETVPLNRIAECTHHLLESGKLVFDGENLKIPSRGSVHTDNYASVIEEFDEMASCSGISLDDLVSGLFTLLENGSITIENGVLSAGTSSWASEFESVCHDLCIPVEKAAEGAIKALKRGGL